jgi:flagellar biosynthesis/type III secretory pathway protein FliH
MNLQSVKFDSKPSSFVLVDSSETVVETAAPLEQVAASPSVSPTELLEKISSKIDQLNNRTDDEVVALAISLARVMVEKLVGCGTDLCEKRLANILDETLAGPDQAIGVYVNAGNFESVTTQFGQKMQSQGVNIVADNSVAFGECLVRFEEYDLVSKIEQQLDDIESHLEELTHE